MSRLGVLRWSPLHKTLNSSISNKTTVTSLLGQIDKDAIVHPDLFIIFSIVGALVLHSTLQHSKKAVISGVFALFCLILSTVFALIIGALLIIFACYRQIVHVIISKTCGKGSFSGLMDGSDVFWAIEEKTSYSIINVLAMADFSFIVSAMKNDQEPLQTICELIMDRILCSPAPFPKLLCVRKQSKFGYLYWEKQSTINIEEHVRFMDIEEEENKTITENTLKGYISSVANSPLPVNNKSTWEILVGKYPVSSATLDSSESRTWSSGSNNRSQYPILFRIHHSLGDGIALINLLMDTLSDPLTRSNTPVTNNSTNSYNLPAPEIKKINTDYEHSFGLDMPQENYPMTKSITYNFNDYYSNNYQQTYPYRLNIIHRAARDGCRKFLKYVEELKLKNNSHHQCNLQDINTMVNDQPSFEFLELIKNSTLPQENNYSQCIITNRKITIDDLKKNNKTLSYLLNSINNLYNLLKICFCHVSTIFLTPACVFNQIIKKNDTNALHGPKLSGYKVIAWHCEQKNNAGLSLFKKIKQIRSKTGAHFSDIILTALSYSLELFFKQCKQIPSHITVVIPARLVAPTINSLTTYIKSENRTTTVTKLFHDATKKELNNKFSVAFLTLPVVGNCSGKVALFSKLRQVCKQTKLLRNSPDYLINYWLLKLVSTFFPVCLLRPIIASTQSSLVVSNIPGPEKPVKLAGHTLYDLVFWVPNKETTGVGITILSYAGRLQLGIIADRALIPCQQDAQLILSDMIFAIQEMDKISTPD